MLNDGATVPLVSSVGRGVLVGCGIAVYSRR
jgi:hypothetical protein